MLETSRSVALRLLGPYWLLALACSFVAASPEVQAQAKLAPGVLVRVTAPSLGLEAHRGRLEAVGAGVLTVDARTISLESVTRLEVGRVRSRSMAVGAAVGLAVALAAGGEYSKTLVPSALAGAAIGASPRYALRYGGVGALAGAVVGAAACAAACSDSDSDINKGGFIVIYGAIGAGGGFGVGALIGALTHLTGWRDVPLGSAR